MFGLKIITKTFLITFRLLFSKYYKSNILIPSLDPFLEEHVPFGKGLTPAICPRMAVFVSRHERVTLITFLLP